MEIKDWGYAFEGWGLMGYDKIQQETNEVTRPPHSWVCLSISGLQRLGLDHTGRFQKACNVWDLTLSMSCFRLFAFKLFLFELWGFLPLLLLFIIPKFGNPGFQTKSDIHIRILLCLGWGIIKLGLPLRPV